MVTLNQRVCWEVSVVLKGEAVTTKCRPLCTAAQVHYAATIAGMSFANAFLGICHSMAHKLGATYHVPHGLANAALISHVIRYNATDAPFKQVRGVMW